MNIEELVSRAKKGDDDAFYELISNLKEQLYRIAFSYLKNEEESLEALQEVTYRAYINIKRLKKAKYFNSWVIRIMINYCINELRNKKRFASEEVLEEKGLQETNSFMNFDWIEIETILNQMEEKYQTVIRLKYLYDLKISDIAFIMNKPEGTVKTWLYKALKKLRENFMEVK